MSISSTAMPGGVIEKSLFRMDLDGNRIEDISDVYNSGTVKYREDLGGGMPTTFGMELIGPDRVAPLTDLVSPYLKITYDDGTVIGPRRFGSFVVPQPDTVITQTVAKKTYPCEDLTAILRDAAFTSVYKIATGSNIRDAIAALILYGGLTQYRLPQSARVTGYKRAFEQGSSVLDAINSLCKAAQWWPVWMSSQAVITTQPMKLLSQSQSVKTYTDADYIGSIQDKPTRGQVGNVVVVKRERSDKPTLYAIRKNTDVDSPISIPNVGREILFGGGPIDAEDAEDQGDVDRLADQLIEEARSYERTVSMTVLPDFDVIGEHRIVDLDINTQGSNFQGRYWLRQWSLGMTPKDAVLQLTLNRWVRAGLGEDI